MGNDARTGCHNDRVFASLGGSHTRISGHPCRTFVAELQLKRGGNVIGVGRERFHHEQVVAAQARGSSLEPREQGRQLGRGLRVPTSLVVGLRPSYSLAKRDEVRRRNVGRVVVIEPP